MTAPRPVLWEPTPKQSQFLACPAFEVLGGGQGGGGKSDCIITAPLRQVHHPQHRALVIRRTYPELQELLDRADGLYPKLGATYSANPTRYTWPSGAFVQFGHAEDGFKTIRRLYHGQQFNDLGVDELTLFEEEKAWTYLLSRLRTTAPDLLVQARATSNPGGPGHAWVKRRFVDACPDDGTPLRVSLGEGQYTTRAFVRFGLNDNPHLTHNDPGYVSRLNLLPELERAQIKDGDWNAGSATYYEDVSPVTHLVPPFKIPAHWHRFGGHDWGYQHPWAFCSLAKNERGELFVADTLWGRRDDDEAIAARIVEAEPLTRGSEFLIRAGGDVFAQQQARRRPDQTYRTSDTYRAAGLTVLRKDDSPGSRKRNAVNLRRLLRTKGRKPDGTLATHTPVLRFFDTPGNRWLVQQLMSTVRDPADPEKPLKVDWTEGDEWPRDRESAPPGDDGVDALAAALSLPVPVVEGVAPRVHEDQAERVSAKLAKREASVGPVVVLPPVVSWAQEWGQTDDGMRDYDEVTA